MAEFSMTKIAFPDEPRFGAYAGKEHWVYFQRDGPERCDVTLTPWFAEGPSVRLEGAARQYALENGHVDSAVLH
jgi:hypothetical protein